MPEHRVEAIANEFLDRAAQEGRALTNMQLQKLPFLAHGWGLALTGGKLLRDQPQAWDYGPVYPRLYDCLRRYGSGTVIEAIRENDARTPFLPEARGAVIREGLDETERRLLDAVWDGYRDYSGFDLSALTHRPGSPWSEVRAHQGLRAPIPDTLMREYFTRMAEQQELGAA